MVNVEGMIVRIVVVTTESKARYSTKLEGFIMLLGLHTQTLT